MFEPATAAPREDDTVYLGARPRGGKNGCWRWCMLMQTAPGGAGVANELCFHFTTPAGPRGLGGAGVAAGGAGSRHRTRKLARVRGRGGARRWLAAPTTYPRCFRNSIGRASTPGRGGLRADTGSLQIAVSSLEKAKGVAYLQHRGHRADMRHGATRSASTPSAASR